MHNTVNVARSSEEKVLTNRSNTIGNFEPYDTQTTLFCAEKQGPASNYPIGNEKVSVHTRIRHSFAVLAGEGYCRIRVVRKIGYRRR